MKLLDAAFAHPHGLPGYIGGFIMARSTGMRNEWTISLLDVKQNDHILEVGFGPGMMIQALTASINEGLIAGIDASPLMLQQARKRNIQAIRDGRVTLQEGSALALPFADASFNKAFSVNSVHIWHDRLSGIKEMWRVLQPGGLIAIMLQPVWARTEGEVKEIGVELVALLSQAGFQQTRLEFKSMKPIATACALAIK